MTYTEFFNIITDNSFDREKYYYILKKCGYRRTKEYFNKFLDRKVEFLPEIYKEGYVIGHTDNYLLIKKKGSIEDLNKITSVVIKKIEYPYCIG